jgi:hypothetical protein
MALDVSRDNMRFIASSLSLPPHLAKYCAILVMISADYTESSLQLGSQRNASFS